MRRLLLITFLVAPLVLAGCVAPPAPEPASGQADAAADSDAASGPANLWLLDGPRPYDVRVSGGAEPIVHITSQGTILVADTSGVYRSTDGGATWVEPAIPVLPRYAFGDGLTVAEDDTGRLYAADTNGQFIGVAVSEDDGKTWESANYAVGVGTIADRPWLAARGDGEVALIFNGDLGEQCLRSTDAGRTWLSASVINHGAANAGNAVFDDDGRLWYTNGAQVWRWSNPCLNAPLPIDLPPSGATVLTPLALDDQGRPFVAQPSPGNDAMELRAVVGRSVTTLVVSPPELASNTFGMVSTHGDEVAVTWYGSETAGNPASTAFDGEWNVYVARVTGFWTADPQVTYTRITTEPNHVGDFCMSGVGCTTGSGDRDLLDYFGITHGADGSVHVAYGHDGDTSSEEVRYAYLPPL